MRPLAGILLQTAYRLQSHFWMAWRLSRWISMALVVSIGAVLVRNWLAPWTALWPALVFLAYAWLLRWSARQGYVLFKPGAAHRASRETPADGWRLQPADRIPVRATGWFTVEGRVQYYVDVEADLTRTGLGEYIVLGRVPASRFLFVGQLPEDLVGWWYMFFQPGRIRGLEAGCAHTRGQPQLALRLVMDGENGREQTLYLSFADGGTLARVWSDLTRANQIAAVQRPRGG